MTEPREDLRQSIRIDPMQGISADVIASLGGTLITLEPVQPGLLDPFKFVVSKALPCTAVRDLFAGTPKAGTVILTCGKTHHMDAHAHRMTNPDGSVTTWRR